ncbi:hypothetical protein [Alistipes sp.]|uniref:hypothetical protein n=1 Tax=Alistipes sp. TaxID=1872444 RepID=UPI000E874FBB|nr:hypothetical protein [Alistipes sp.]HBX91070.1 hypothetical protein [Alistipes sp.]HCN14223.1 hypothetical protein [Alistipes sp.]
MIEIITRSIAITASAEERARHEARHGESMRVPTVTQTAPDDDNSPCCRIVPSAKGESPSREQLEQDVMITNPSVESMESRG